MHIVVPAGGIGAARFLTGLLAEIPEARITVIGNTADDIVLHGLRICPDLDTVMYTLGGGSDPDRGWGRAGETYTVLDELNAYGKDSTWFTLGDRDIATHLIRTQMLAAGYTLSQVTAALCRRWDPGVDLLPMTDDRVMTFVIADSPAGEVEMHFQEWWVRYRAEIPAARFDFRGAEQATAAPGVLSAIGEADLVLLPPSNPVVSLGPILAVPGIRQALGEAARVVGVSPIIGGAPVRGMADACLSALGVPVSAAGVAGHLGARAAGGILDSWVVDTADAGQAYPEGLAVVAAPGLMSDLAAARQLARAALDAS